MQSSRQTRPRPSRTTDKMSLQSLEQAVGALEQLDKTAKIQGLIHLAERLPSLAPQPQDTWDIHDARQDQECLDVLALYAKRLENGQVRLAAEVGEEATTMTRALTALLVQNLSGETTQNILSVGQDVIPRAIGEALLRQRSSGAYYTLRRLHEVIRALEDQKAHSAR